MSSFKRTVFGMIVNETLYIRTYEKGYQVLGRDKVGRDVVIARRKELEGAVGDGVKAARMLAGIKKKTVRLEVLSERIEEFSPEDE